MTSSGLNRLTTIAMVAATFMLGHQVAGKAVRDGLFLSRFPATELPKIVAAAALLAVVFAVVFSRLLARYGPGRLVPVAFLLSGALHLAEYGAIGGARDVTVYLIYLHIVGFGAILLSGFWSLASEIFDPREAKLRFGRIAGMGTAGGIAGGLLAERTVVLFSTELLLVLLGVFHLVAGSLMLLLSRHVVPLGKRGQAGEGIAAVRRAYAGAPFLVSLAVLVILGTTSAALLDYLFKSGASAAFGKGPNLTRYFAIYYTGGQVLTFLVQSLLTPIALSRLGLGKSVMSLALAVATGSAGALALPLFPMVASVRALELILRGSLFRSGYELFFTPITAGEKRAVKTMIDVGCDRLGDAFGAALVQLILLWPAQARTEMLVLTIAIAGVSVWITTRMDAAYLGVLERGLMNRAIELDLDEIHDSTTRSAVLRTVGMKQTPAEGVKRTVRPVTAQLPSDGVLEMLGELRCGDPARVRTALGRLGGSYDMVIGPQLVRLLAWDEVSEAARMALTAAGGRVTGMLTDALVDEKTDFAIRRRIPRILARTGTQRAVEALLMALEDSQFEVRFQASRALDYLKQMNPELRFDEDRIFAVVQRELSVAKPIWQGRRLLDARDGTDSGFSYLDGVLRDRANQSLENVFSLLAVVSPREPLQVAFRALHAEDQLLRGLGLEYLEGVLPVRINGMLTAILEAAPPTEHGKNPEEVLARLMKSQNSILLRMKKSE